MYQRISGDISQSAYRRPASFHVHDVQLPFTLMPMLGQMRHSMPKSGVRLAHLRRLALMETCVCNLSAYRSLPSCSGILLFAGRIPCRQDATGEAGTPGIPGGFWPRAVSATVPSGMPGKGSLSSGNLPAVSASGSASEGNTMRADTYSPSPLWFCVTKHSSVKPCRRMSSDFTRLDRILAMCRLRPSLCVEAQ